MNTHSELLKKKYHLNDDELPLFGIGQHVKVAVASDREYYVIKWRNYNGVTWMYAFENTDLRCGEIYMQPHDN